MAFFRIFRLPQNQQFEYKPRFWDQKEEELEKRLKMYEEGADADVEEMKKRISGRFRKRGYMPEQQTYRTRQIRRSNRLLFYIIIILLLVGYLLVSNQAGSILKFLE